MGLIEGVQGSLLRCNAEGCKTETWVTEAEVDFMYEQDALPSRVVAKGWRGGPWAVLPGVVEILAYCPEHATIWTQNDADRGDG